MPVLDLDQYGNIIQRELLDIEIIVAIGYPPAKAASGSTTFQFTTRTGADVNIALTNPGQIPFTYRDGSAAPLPIILQ